MNSLSLFTPLQPDSRTQFLRLIRSLSGNYSSHNVTLLNEIFENYTLIPLTISIDALQECTLGIENAILSSVSNDANNTDLVCPNRFNSSHIGKWSLQLLTRMMTDPNEKDWQLTENTLNELSNMLTQHLLKGFVSYTELQKLHSELLKLYETPTAQQQSSSSSSESASFLHKDHFDWFHSWFDHIPLLIALCESKDNRILGDHNIHLEAQITCLQEKYARNLMNTLEESIIQQQSQNSKQQTDEESVKTDKTRGFLESLFD